MQFIILLILVSATQAKLQLGSVLQSPQRTLKLYSDFKVNNQIEYDSSEDRMRYRIFKMTAAQVMADNDNDDETAEYDLNFFATMTADEKKSYLGLNVTGHSPVPESRLSRRTAVPDTKLWTSDANKVTAVKNQGSCGSCWTFGAVAAAETAYAIKTGVLRAFAEQEYLDCVYESEDGKDGCNGGWPSNCWKYSKEQGGRLASLADYPYAAADGACKSSSTADSMIGAKINGFIDVESGEAAHIEAIALGAVNVAFEVSNHFYSYKTGIMKDHSCPFSGANHAVTAVGYSPLYVLVKNSWGATWGESGFVRFARNFHNCYLFEYGSFPVLSATAAADSGNDAAADFVVPDNNDIIAAKCVDLVDWCEKPDWADYCKYDWYETMYCPKHCGYCKDADDGDDGDDADADCPSGTVKCDDGVCRHEHMC